jgi:dienelactone hydrolase
MPDYLHGDPIPVEYMTAKVHALFINVAGQADSRSSYQTPFDTDAWFKTHGPGDTRPLLEAVIAALRAEGVTTFGATGYCFGGKYAIDLARENVTKAIAISHPGLLELPADFEAWPVSTVDGRH